MGTRKSLRHAIGQSLTWLARQPAGQQLTFGPRSVTVAEQAQFLRRVLDMLADDPSPEVLEDRMLAAAEILRSAGGGDGAMLVTGYHEPIVDASERPNAEYRVPILGVPRNLGAAGRTPFLTRTEIEQGRLGPFARPLAWARDPSSWRSRGAGPCGCPAGASCAWATPRPTAARTGSIAKLLIDTGRISREAMSMRALRQWLAEHPEERARVLRHNESYVFFRVLCSTRCSSTSTTGCASGPSTSSSGPAASARGWPSRLCC
jgi:membrane-bound lytic murein transglycosylase A